ncbi:MAG: SDR family oxidoreductase [Myxococcota bacterium]
MAEAVRTPRDDQKASLRKATWGRPELDPIRSFEGKHIVLTGVTGFLGKVWLTMLLDFLPSVQRVSVVCRKKTGSSASERFAELVDTSPALTPLRRRHGARFRDFIDDKVRVIEGDGTKPLFGVSPSLVESADLVANFAGLTDFEPDPAIALTTNTLGALHAAELCAQTSGKRLMHVSTCYVAGRVSGEVAEHLDYGRSPLERDFDPQSELDAVRDTLDRCRTKRERIAQLMVRAERLGWPNVYTYTKGLAEHLLHSRVDICTTTIRPSIVESARTYPFAGWNEGINTSGPLVWLFSTSFRHFPSRPRHHFDVVPVDSVARGALLIAAEMLENRAEDVYQLASSDINPFTFRRAIELTNLGVRRMHANPEQGFGQKVLRHLDVMPVSAKATPLLGVQRMQQAARQGVHWLRQLNLREELPTSVWNRFGERAEKHRKKQAQRLRNFDRTMNRVQEMLRLYRPFIHDHDYVFSTARIHGLNKRLSHEQQKRLGYDVGTIDWHDYWLNIHVPGLERWCLPLLRGEKIPAEPIDLDDEERIHQIVSENSVAPAEDRVR